jgi:hypothetical protein
MIKDIDNFSAIETEFGDVDFNDGSMKLFFDGKSTGKKISGDALRRQFSIEEYYLIIMYQDGAFEGPDYLSATLIDKQFNQIDEKFISWEGVDLTLDDAVPISDNEIRISFTNDASVVIQICKIPFLPIKPFIWIRKWKRPNNK